MTEDQERPPERVDLDQLLSAMLEFAEELLRDEGAFHPFGGWMFASGEIALLGAQMDEEYPLASDTIEVLVQGLRAEARAGTVIATALCYDVTAETEDGQTTDAIAVALEHRLGDAVTVLRPYAPAQDEAFRYGELIATTGERRVFLLN